MASGSGGIDETPRPVQSLDEIVAFKNLRDVWRKRVRPGLKDIKFRDFYFAQDPIQFAAYEWGLDLLIEGLREEVSSGRYTPGPAQIYRGAKNQGLSRPLASLAPRDALMFLAITSAADDQLRRNIRNWTGASKADKQRIQNRAATASDRSEVDEQEEAANLPPSPDEPEANDDVLASLGLAVGSIEPDEDWFSVWLTSIGIVATICEKSHFVVEADIANFFPSLDLEVVREHLLNQTTLDKESVRLCVSICRRALPHPAFADSPSMGLPQEPFGSSRVIAHSLLTEVDVDFEDKGASGLYSRFMDDFAIGVNSVEEGHSVISRLQESLEPLGLALNTAKTRVSSTPDFLRDYMAETNAALEKYEARYGEVKAKGELTGDDQLAELQVELRRMFEAHRSTNKPLPKRWDRVLRRFYTHSREIGESHFLPTAIEDLRAQPASAGHILEYVRSFPLTEKTTEDLCDLAMDLSGLYGDIPLLAIEAIGTAPNSKDLALHEVISQRVSNLLRWCVDTSSGPGDLRDRMAASTVPVLNKFGNNATRQMVASECQKLDTTSIARLHGSVIGVAIGSPDQALLSRATPGLPWEHVLPLRFLEALTGGDEEAVGVGLSLVSASKRLLPLRAHVHIRPLMLLPTLLKVAPRRVSEACNRSLTALAENEDRLRDYRTEIVLSEFR